MTYKTGAQIRELIFTERFQLKKWIFRPETNVLILLITYVQSDGFYITFYDFLQHLFLPLHLLLVLFNVLFYVRIKKYYNNNYQLEQITS